MSSENYSHFKSGLRPSDSVTTVFSIGHHLVPYLHSYPEVLGKVVT